MPKFLTMHEEGHLDRILLESRWTELSKETRAEWVMTLYNTDLGIRVCEWDAPNRQVIERIFTDLGIKWSEIMEVEVTRPSNWRHSEQVRRIGHLRVTDSGTVKKRRGDDRSLTSRHMVGQKG